MKTTVPVLLTILLILEHGVKLIMTNHPLLAMLYFITGWAIAHDYFVKPFSFNKKVF